MGWGAGQFACERRAEGESAVSRYLLTLGGDVKTSETESRKPG